MSLSVSEVIASSRWSSFTGGVVQGILCLFAIHTQMARKSRWRILSRPPWQMRLDLKGGEARPPLSGATPRVLLTRMQHTESGTGAHECRGAALGLTDKEEPTCSAAPANHSSPARASPGKRTLAECLTYLVFVVIASHRSGTICVFGLTGLSSSLFKPAVRVWFCVFTQNRYQDALCHLLTVVAILRRKCMAWSSLTFPL